MYDDIWHNNVFIWSINRWGPLLTKEYPINYSLQWFLPKPPHGGFGNFFHWCLCRNRYGVPSLKMKWKVPQKKLIFYNDNWCLHLRSYLLLSPSDLILEYWTSLVFRSLLYLSVTSEKDRKQFVKGCSFWIKLFYE